MQDSSAKSTKGTSIALKLMFFGAVMILIFAVGVAGVFFKYQNLLKPVDVENKKEIKVTIPHGTNSKTIGQKLEDKGLINNSLAFRYYLVFNDLDGKLQAGEYVLNTAMSTQQIVSKLVKGETSSFTFTVPEGYTVTQITDLLERKGYIDKDKFLDLLANGKFEYDFIKSLPAGKNRLEGYLFPDTYKINNKTTEYQIIDMMLKRMSKEITPEFRSKAGELGLTVHEAVTLASIIEREAQKDSERPKVAAVFINRLKKNWRLESCATVQYALGSPKPRLLNEDLKIDSIYNTYLHDGLPPGPICCPGKASLTAAVNPADVDYMFFVVFEDGKHVFSRTLAEHNRNKAMYLNKLNN